MILDEQLLQSQSPMFQGMFVPEMNLEVGLLANRSIQTPGIAALAFHGKFSLREVAEAVHVENVRSVEMNWLVENAENLKRYKGEWLLIQERQLIAHSPEFASVRAAIRDRRLRSPFVYYVPTDEESNSVTV